MSDRRADVSNATSQLAFFHLTPEAREVFPEILAALDRHAPDVMTDFYKHVRATPAAAAIFRSPEIMDHARQKQLQHWRTMFVSDLGPDYADSAQRIGSTHAAIGLEPHWYIGGYAVVLEGLIERMMADSLSQRISGKRLGRSIAGLVKVALYDMNVALSAYSEIEDKKRTDVIEVIGSALTDIANGDFSQSLKALPPGFEKIAEDFGKMQTQMRQAMQLLADSSEVIRSGSSEISQASDNLSLRTEQQAAGLEEAAAAMSEITETVKQTAQGAQQVRRSVADAQTDAETGGAVVRDAIVAMDGIERSSQEISQIIGVIDGIAFQTNLLALNAGVEAARAGDAGKGFAVVANEVRALAQRSADAAKNIKELISASSREVAEGVRLVGETGKSLQRIVGKVADIQGLAVTISAASESQSQSLVQINVAVAEMEQATQQNTAMVEESTAAARTLASEADRLASIVGQFRVRGGDSMMRAPVPIAVPAAPKRRARGPMTTGNLAHAVNGDDWTDF